MIVSHKYRFIVATPTKNGTTTLQSFVETWLRRGGDTRVLCLLRGASETKHRMQPPDGCEQYDRHMVTRDPRTRLPSMYEWLRRRPNDEPIGRMILNVEDHRGRAHGWAAFIDHVHQLRTTTEYYRPAVRKAGARRPYMWTDSQEMLYDYLYGRDADNSWLPWGKVTGEGWHIDTVRSEELESDWLSLLDAHDVEEDDLYEIPVKHLNSTRAEDRLANGWEEYRDMLGVDAYARWERLVEDDADFLYQPVMGGL